MAQTITKKPGEDILIVDAVVIPPPDETPPPAGTVDIVAGTTTTLAPGTPATVVKDSQSTPAKAIFNFGIPQGIQGNPGSPGSGTGTVTAGRGVFDVMNFGAKGDGSTDDSPAFNAAYQAARQVNGRVIFPYPNNFYRLNSPVNIVPDASGQVWVDLMGMGGKAGMIQYFGPSGTCAFKIRGMKASSIEGLHVDLAGNTANRQAFDLETISGMRSITGNTFRNCFIRLGGGQDAIGIRTGFGPDHGDISLLNFENISIYGTAEHQNVQPVVVTPGQYGFQNLGENTLQIQIIGGIAAGCDRAYTNITRDGSDRGNGAVSFFGFDGSHNNEDFVFSWEQTYTIIGGRYELGNRFIRITDNGAFSHVSVYNATVHEYAGINGNLIEIGGESSVELRNSTFAKVGGGKYSSPITITKNNAYGALAVSGCSFTSDVIYTKPGQSNFDISLRGNIKMGASWRSVGLFANQ